MTATFSSVSFRQAQKHLSVVLAAVLTACGGGGDSDNPTSSGELQPLSGYAVLQGTLTDSTGAALSGATVSMPFGAGQAWAGNTDTQGRFAFQARASDYTSVSPVAMVIEKAGYRPSTVYFSSINAGNRYAVPASPATSPSALAAGQFVPRDFAGLLHLGDASFSGAINSQLQTTTRGRFADFLIKTWTVQDKAQYSYATVEFVGRGVQGLTCRDQVGLASVGADIAAGIPRYLNPGSSDPNGGFSRFSLRLNVSDFRVGDTVRLVAISGACANDYDDFEIGEPVVRFER